MTAPTTTLRRAGALLFLACAACRAPRLDDAYEPNDDLAHATPLVLDVPLIARANQGNPDVFVVDVPAAATLVFRAESLGLEECAGFSATGPDGTVLFRVAAGCDASHEPLVRAAGVESEHSDELFVLSLPVASGGLHYLTILEGAESDNLFDFSWDYRLTASVR